MPTSTDTLTNLQNAIAKRESQNNYGAIGKPTVTGDRAYGKYQIMGANIPSWTKAATGQAMTPEQFLADSKAQDATTTHQLSQLYSQYKNPADVASAWFSGKPLAKAGNEKDVNGTDVPSYVKDVLKFMGGGVADAATVPDSQQSSGAPAQLSHEHLVANINAMEQQGASQQEIQNYLDSLKGGQTNQNNPPDTGSQVPVQPLQPQGQSNTDTTNGLPITKLNIPEGMSTDTKPPLDPAQFMAPEFRMGTATAPSQQEGKDFLKGGAKGVLSSLQSADSLYTANKLAGRDADFTGLTSEQRAQASAPSNASEQIGSIGSQAAASALPVGDAVEATSGFLQKPLALKRLSSTADSLSTRELEANASLVKPNGKLAPSPTETRAADLLAGKTARNPVQTFSAVNNEIATRGKEVEAFLEANAKPITNQEDFNAFNAIKNSSKKYMTPAEAKAYDEQIGVFQKILKGYGKYSTPNYYKALKEYESQVTANLPKGKDALLVPGGSARIQAAKDVRKVVRDMVASKNPEFKGKMFDLASLYDVKDTVAGQVASKAKNSTSFAKRHPYVTGLLGMGLGGAATGLGIQETNSIKGWLSPSGQ